MATRRRSSRGPLGPALTSTVALALMGSWACLGGSGSENSSGSGDAGESGGSSDLAAQVLESVALQVVVPATASFSTASASLATEVAAHASAARERPAEVEAALATAQTAWETAMSEWQKLEVMQIGPAAPVLTIGGEGLRDEVYSWPSANACTVDRALVANEFATATFFADSQVDAYGLAALEYLLFHHEPTHHCPPQIKLDPAWDALGLAEIELRRADYAAVLATEVARRATELHRRWDPAQDDFAALLAHPGTGASPYASQTEALDEVFRAMFYVDLYSKDLKLARTLGIAEGCTAVPCRDLLESRWALHSTASLVANLQALRLLVTGGPDAAAPGFDDMLVDAGHPEVGETLLADVDAAIALLSGLGVSLQELLDAGDVAQVTAVHAAIKRITDTLKGPFVMVLRLKVPLEGSGDND